MRRDHEGVTRCRLCGAVLSVPADVEPQLMVVGAGGKPNQRVLIVDGKEVHRCRARPEDAR